MIQSATNSDTAIRIRGLSKSYTIQKGGLEKQSTLAESALARLKNPCKRVEKETFHALKDIDLDIKKGEVVGIIGRNGAGKSTLLKVLSRITYPTTGQVDLYGRVGSLLEVGTGFHSELTGRENIFLNGAILGMTRPEITREFDAIVEFSGVEKFLDTPVKRYSSGMYVRLAFAVAAHLRTEILIVDEVLAVGDARFQQKCLGKMKQVSQHDGRSVLFVSHQMQMIQNLCSRCILMTGGAVDVDGEVMKAIAEYGCSFEKVGDRWSHLQLPQDKTRFVDVTATKETFACAEPKRIRFRIINGGELNRYFISCHIYDLSGVVVAHCDSRLSGMWVESQGDFFECTVELRTPWLKPGRYRVEAMICSAGLIDRVDDAAFFEVLPVYPYASAIDEGLRNSSTLADFEYCPAPQIAGAYGKSSFATERSDC